MSDFEDALEAAFDEIAQLQADNSELSAEAERLQSKLNRRVSYDQACIDLRDEALAEVERLRDALESQWQEANATIEEVSQERDHHRETLRKLRDHISSVVEMCRRQEHKFSQRLNVKKPSTIPAEAAAERMALQSIEVQLHEREPWLFEEVDDG